MSKKQTALAKPMEPLFSVAPAPRWKPGDLLKLARVWLAREQMLEYLRTYGMIVLGEDGVML